METENKPAGRPEIPIDWNEVDALLAAGCSGTAIATSLGFSNDTLYRRAKLEKGVDFTTYSAEKRTKGDNSLRKVQYDKALGGDNMMLIWLGKNRLEQRDNHDHTHSLNAESVEKLEKTMDMVEYMRAKISAVTVSETQPNESPAI